MKVTKADKWFSLYIRLRDTENGLCKCISCGKLHDPKEMTIGHYIKRQHQATRFNEMNHAQCTYCNYRLQGNDVNYRRALVEIYGEDRVLLFEASKRVICKTDQYKLDYLAAYYKGKATELARAKNIKLW